MNSFSLLFILLHFYGGLTRIHPIYSQLPLDLTPRLDISWDKKFITYYKLKYGVIVDLEVKYFYTFQDYLAQLTIGTWRISELEKTESASKTTQGLVPEIELPNVLPAPVAGIIGQGGKLDVSGSQRIEFGGSKTQSLQRKETEQSYESWFPQLEMEQHLGVNLKGTIGEKIHVFIDHDSEREFDLKNTVRLEYKGYEDEILQSIKAGNTDLSLPGIALIGGATAHKGLFGIKAESKIGPVNITTIASREEAENQSKQWKGGGVSEREMLIEDINFVKSKFFLLAPPKYLRSLQDMHNIYSGDNSLLPKQILSFHVYLDRGETWGEESQIELPGTAFDIPNQHYQDSISVTDGKFAEKLPGEEEFFILDTTYLGISYRFPLLELNSGLMDEDLLAIRWIYKNWKGETDTVGCALTDSLKQLQIIKRERTQGESDTSYLSWWYELKNIYSIGGAEISDIELKVFKHNYGGTEDFEVLPGTDITYCRFLGLERADGRLDLARIFDATRGILIFPSPYPFVLDTTGIMPVDSFGMESDSIYTIPNFTADVRPKYYIWVKYRGVKTEYSLGMVNIIPESEVVKIDGQTMRRDTDYEIDYDSGIIKFLTPLAENPNANISVDFQYVPIFQPTAKNLIGTRVESKIGDLGTLSSAFLYHSTSCLDFRPRLGTEPRRILLGELVGNISTQPDWLTRWVDNIPLVETDATSSFSLQGNAGFSLPNPNTRGEVYLDDMEAAKSTHSLGISRLDWSYGSLPPERSPDDFAQIQWYNPRDGIRKYELYPDLPEHKRNDKMNVLMLKLPQEDNWRFPDTGSVYWTTLLSCVSTRGYDYSESEFLEVWVRGEKGILHIDIGTDVPEDAIRRDGRGDVQGPNGLLDTEDKDDNNKLSNEEDVGIDGVSGADGSKILGDDWNDDYHYDSDNPEDYSKINGTELNNYLDEEDLDNDDILNKESNYFSFEIDIPNRPPTIERTNGWKLFRIPINDYDEKKGIPQWECIKYTRIWIEQLSKGAQIEIAALDIVGNKWKHQGSNQVKICVKNTDENPNEYFPPPIELEVDPYGRKEKEQSLVLNYADGLLPNTEGGCYTIYTTPRNLIQYKTLKLWVRGTGGAKFFIRISGNKFNYYEYRTEIPNSWTDFSLNLEDIAQFKLKKPPTDTGVFAYKNYRIYGSPSFTNISRIEVGVINDNTATVSGEVWVNELRLTDVRREGGVAGNLKFSSKFADLADFSVAYRANDPYFQSLGNFMALREALGTNSQRSLAINSNLHLNKFLPSTWGFSLPLGLGITKTKSSPTYQTGSDVILTKEQSDKQSSFSLLRTCNFNFAKSGSKNPFLKLTLDNMKGAFSYRDALSDAFTQIDSSQAYSTSLSYGYSPQLPPIKFKGIEFRYYPQQISVSSSFSYSKARQYRMTIQEDTLRDTTRAIIRDSIHIDTSYILTNPTPPSRALSKGAGLSYKPINPITLNYSLSMTNDLNLEGDSTRFDSRKKRYDTETGRAERAGYSFAPSLFSLVSPSVNYSTTYQENHSPQLDSLRNVSNSNQISFRLPVNLSKSLSLLARIRDEKLDSLAAFPSPHWLLIKIQNFSHFLSMPEFSHSIARSSQFYDLLDPPSYQYRWGITPYPPQWPPDYRNSTSITRTYALSRVGFRVGNFSISSGWEQKTSVSGRMGSETRSFHTGSPKLDLSFSGLQKLPLLKNWFTSVTSSFSYTTNLDKSGPKSLPFNSITRDVQFGASLRTQLKKGISTGFLANFTNGEKEQITYPPQIIKTKRADYSVNASHSFRAPQGIKLPLLSHIKWTSNLNVSLTTTFSTDWEKNVKKPTPTRDSKSITLNPQASYNFSSTITGGASLTYSQQWDKVNVIANTRNVGLRFFAEFSF